MIRQLTVTPGTTAPMPPSVATVTATDFAMGQLPRREPGRNLVRLRN
jgi:hypothetical protein